MIPIEAILEECDRQKIECTLALHPNMFNTGDLWHCRLEQTVDGVTLEVTKWASSGPNAIRQAWATFNAAAQTGLPALPAPQVEPANSDDEIPF